MLKQKTQKKDEVTGPKFESLEDKAKLMPVLRRIVDYKNDIAELSEKLESREKRNLNFTMILDSLEQKSLALKTDEQRLGDALHEAKEEAKRQFNRYVNVRSELKRQYGLLDDRSEEALRIQEENLNLLEISQSKSKKYKSLIEANKNIEEKVVDLKKEKSYYLEYMAKFERSFANELEREESLTTEKDFHDIELLKLKKSLRECDERLSQQTTATEQKQAEINVLKRECDELSAVQEDQSKALKSLESVYINQQFDLNSLQKKKTELAKDTREIDFQLEIYERKLEKLSKDSTDMIAQVESFEREKLELESQLNLLVSESESFEFSNNRILEKLEKEREMISLLKEKADSEENRNKALKAENKKLENALNSSISDNKSLEEELNHLELSNKDLTEGKEGMSSELEILKSQIDQTINLKAMLLEKNAVLEKENTKLTFGLGNMRTHWQSLEGSDESLKEIYEKNIADKNSLVRESDTLNLESAELEKEVKSLELKLKTLDSENETLRASNKRALENFEKLKTRLDNVQSRYLEARDENRVLREDAQLVSEISSGSNEGPAQNKKETFVTSRQVRP